jgi:hypothetical protein
MNKWLEILTGLILVILVLIGAITNYLGLGTSALVVLKGGLVWIVGLVGLLFLILGISDLKE